MTLSNKIKSFALGAAALAAFAAAAGFYWGLAEALLNHYRPPAATWQPDSLLASVYGRTLFYALAAAAFALAAEGVKALSRLRRGRGAGRREPRRWRGAVAAAAVTASSAGWYVLAGANDGEVKLFRLFSLNVHEAGGFFGYWAFFVGAGAALALALGFLLGRRRRAAVVARALAVAGAVGFVGVVSLFWGARARRPRPAGPNVVLIILDAWRADTLNIVLMPELCKFGRENAFHFERAWTNATWTLPSMGTVFTGQYPDISQCRTRERADYYCPSLAQLLRAEGYDTTAFVANRILDRDHPITDGFDNFYFSDWIPALRWLHFYDSDWYGPAVRDLFHEEPTYKDNLILSRGLLSYTSRPHRRPYFAWVHYMDPHGPYWPPPGYYAAADEKYILDYKPFNRERAAPNKRLYFGECVFMDDLLAATLPRVAADPRTIIIITADHGEEFWEHGKLHFGHGKSAYDTLTRIPLLVSLPGRRAGVIETPVSLVDLAPTVMTLAGYKPAPTMQGRPFFTGAGEPIEEDRPVFFGSSFFKLEDGKPYRFDAVVVWPHKLMARHSSPGYGGRYYDLAVDPGERKMVVMDEKSRRMRRALVHWLADTSHAREEPDYGGAAAPDLRALGYIQ